MTIGLRFTVPAVPGTLVLVAGGLVASAVFDLGAHGVALVGHVPRGLPSPELPHWQLVRTHLSTIGIASFALLLIGFSQTAGDARAFATRHRYRIDVNQESVAQGMANATAGNTRAGMCSVASSPRAWRARRAQSRESHASSSTAAER